MSSPTTKSLAAARRAGATTTDDFLGGRIGVVQPRGGHRAGSDAVFLAAAVRPRGRARARCRRGRRRGRALPPGARTRRRGDRGRDRRQALRACGRECRAERLRATSSIVNADVTAPGKSLRAAGLDARKLRSGHRQPALPRRREASGPRPIARVPRRTSWPGGLAAWVRFFAAMAAPKALLTLIHRPDCLGELLPLLDGRFGDIAVFPLFPKRGEPATRIIVQAGKEAGPA